MIGAHVLKHAKNFGPVQEIGKDCWIRHVEGPILSGARRYRKSLSNNTKGPP